MLDLNVDSIVIVLKDIQCVHLKENKITFFKDSIILPMLTSTPFPWSRKSFGSTDQSYKLKKIYLERKKKEGERREKITRSDMFGFMAVVNVDCCQHQHEQQAQQDRSWRSRFMDFRAGHNSRVKIQNMNLFSYWRGVVNVENTNKKGNI